MHSSDHSLDRRRMFIALLIIAACFAIWILRLFWIQFVSTSNFFDRKSALLRNSINQRMKSIVVDNGRGDIYDRYMQPLTGWWIRSLVVFPLKRSGDISREWESMANILEVDFDHWMSFVDGLTQPRLWMENKGRYPAAISEQQEKKMRALNIPGIEIVDYKVRYSDESIARQLIGFMAEHPEHVRKYHVDQLRKGDLTIATPIGSSGLERTFEPFLRGTNAIKVSIFSDAHEQYMAGLATRITATKNPYYPVKLMTTIDKKIQQTVEDILDRYQIKEGSVVVLDVENADIRAMVSRPQFDPYQVNPSLPHWNNRALKAIIPGSVFKTVVAAAALENDVVSEDEVFQCDGHLGKYGFTCWKKTGHGRLTFKQAYVQSCNITFAKVMERLTSFQLEQAARQLGLMQRVGWSGSLPGFPLFHQFDSEDAGQIFAEGTPKQDGGVLSQTSIGQRDVRMSVLQAANLVVSLLNHGEVKSPRVVKEIRYHNNRLKHSFPVRTLVAKKVGISRKTAEILLAWMEETVDWGTAKALRSASWKLAGKTGTAQVQSGANELVNQWFAGYGAVDDPSYAIAVVVENIPGDHENLAVQLSREIMNALAIQ